jgi:UDP-GlcNAc:undecaprenyl-phosphate GlcNAc-1-phosphate transferase
VPLLVVAIPILDASVAIVTRIFRGVSPFQGGKDHLSHRLMQKGFGKQSAVITLWLMTALFGALAILVSFTPYELEIYATIFGFILWCLLFAVFVKFPNLN